MMRDGRTDQNKHERAIPVPSHRDKGPIHFPELQVLERAIFRDSRGAFAELWREDDGRALGLPVFVQDNIARSAYGVVRGLHFQNPRPQGKLISVVMGEIFDVVVDVRVGSPTFGRWASFGLSDSNGHQLYVPPGFAHGYQTVSDLSVVVYKCSDFYSPDDERAVRWNDGELGIRWPIRDAVVSSRDAAAPALRDLLAERLPQMEP